MLLQYVYVYILCSSTNLKSTPPTCHPVCIGLVTKTGGFFPPFHSNFCDGDVTLEVPMYSCSFPVLQFVAPVWHKWFILEQNQSNTLWWSESSVFQHFSLSCSSSSAKICFIKSFSADTFSLSKQTQKFQSLRRCKLKGKTKSLSFRFAVTETLAIWASPLNSHLGLVIIASSCSFSSPCQKLLCPHLHHNNCLFDHHWNQICP